MCWIYTTLKKFVETQGRNCAVAANCGSSCYSSTSLISVPATRSLLLSDRRQFAAEELETKANSGLAAVPAALAVSSISSNLIPFGLMGVLLRGLQSGSDSVLHQRNHQMIRTGHLHCPDKFSYFRLKCC